MITMGFVAFSVVGGAAMAAGGWAWSQVTTKHHMPWSKSK